MPRALCAFRRLLAMTTYQLPTRIFHQGTGTFAGINKK